MHKTDFLKFLYTKIRRRDFQKKSNVVFIYRNYFEIPI